MASLVRPSYTVHVLAGKRVPKGTPGAKRVRKKASKWYGQGIPGLPPKKRVPLSSRKADAERMLAALVRDGERGQLDLPTTAARRKPLAAYLAEFDTAAKLGLASRSRGRKRRPDPSQIDLVVQRVGDVLEGCSLILPADLNSAAPAKVATYLQGRVAKPKAEGGLSHQSANFFLSAVRRFLWWAAAKAKAPVRADLLDDVPGFDPAGNRVHARREISPEELARLLITTRASARNHRGLSGEDRYLLYLTAFGSGFRSGELAILQPSGFNLDADPPFVCLPANYSKNKKGARQPLPPEVAAQLRDYLVGRIADEPVWDGKWAGRPAAMLVRDLEDAGVPYRVETPDGPKFADFHALRHTYLSALSAAGVGVKELMELARHSDPRLTLGVYTHARAGMLGDSVARLPMPTAAGKNPLSGYTRAELEAIIVGLAAAANVALDALAPLLAPAVERERGPVSGIGAGGVSGKTKKAPAKPGRERVRSQ